MSGQHEHPYITFGAALHLKGQNRKILFREVEHGFRTIHVEWVGTRVENRRWNHIDWVGLAVVGGTSGIVLAVVGLVPLLAGVLDVCLFAPLFGAPLKGTDVRAHAKS